MSSQECGKIQWKRNRKSDYFCVNHWLLTYLAWEVAIHIILTAIAGCFISVHVWPHGWNCPSSKNPPKLPGLITEQIFLLLQKEICFIERSFVMYLMQLLFCYLTWTWFPVCSSSATYMYREEKVICHQAILLEYKFQLYIDFGELMVCLLELVINK